MSTGGKVSEISFPPQLKSLPGETLPSPAESPWLLFLWADFRGSWTGVSGGLQDGHHPETKEYKKPSLSTSQGQKRDGAGRDSTTAGNQEG